MPAIAAGAAVVGAGIGIYGAVKSANDQAHLDQIRAGIAEDQAGEIASREAANESLRDSAAMRQKLQFGSSYAASGKAGTGVGSQLQIQKQADLMNMMSNREATFQEKMLYQQAGIDTSLADETLRAGTLKAVGAGLGGLSSVAGIGMGGGANPGFGGPQSMGSYPSASPGSYGGG